MNWILFTTVLLAPVLTSAQTGTPDMASRLRACAALASQAERVLCYDAITAALPDTATLRMVLFPHDIHTAWLECSNCHPKIFAEKAGATPVNMLAILQGEYCGRCHGAVSFPLTECNRCHSVPWKK